MPNDEINLDVNTQGEHPEHSTPHLFITDQVASNEAENDTSSSLPPTNTRNFSLHKQVISNKSAKDYLDRSFNELIDTGIDVRIERFFEIYEQLFYKIDKFKSPDQQTHYTLVDQSLDIIL